MNERTETSPVREPNVADLTRPSKAIEDSVRARGIPSNASYTRADLLRDTYVPSPDAQGYPRAVRLANQSS